MSSAPADVLIVGAGPTGLMAAAQLLRWGVRPRIVDRNPGPSCHTKALAVQARSLELYAQLGLADEVLARGVPMRALNLFPEHGRPIRASLGDIGAGLSPFPFIFILGQDENERILGSALATAGLSVEWNTTLTALEQGDDGARVTLTRTDGGIETATARHVLAADGAHSAVRHLLGETSDGDAYPPRYVVADLTVAGEAVAGEMNLFPNPVLPFLAFFPLPGPRHFRLVTTLPTELEHLDQPTFDDLRPRLEAILRGRVRVEQVAWFSTFRAYRRVARRFRVGACFLLGDAAHVHSPAGAQGMNTGLQDAANLAWKLALVRRGDAHPALLDTYEEERRPYALKLVAGTDRLFASFASPRPLLRRVRRVGLTLAPHIVSLLLGRTAVRRFLFRAVSQIGVEYRAGRLAADHRGGRVRAGDRFPWFRYRDGGGERDVFDHLRPARFVLFALGAGAADREALARPRAPLLDVVAIADAPAYRASGLADGVYLVRPDGYIGYRARQLDAAAISAYLRDRIGLTPEQRPVSPTAGGEG